MMKRGYCGYFKMVGGLVIFRYTFVTIGLLTILSAHSFSKLHATDGDNLKG